MTRIVAGSARGRRLRTPTGQRTRPTADRVREALFSALESALGSLEGLRVLDLYAGSGALGLEALSRGAASALFVEADHRACTVIGQNIASLGVAGATVRRGSVGAVLAAGADRPVDLVFADPPYELGDTEVGEILAALVEGGWTEPGTIAVVERGASGSALKWPDAWTVWPQRRYGDTRLELAERI